MIAHLSYVRCDECGSPAEPAGSAVEARTEARRAKWVVKPDSPRDLCPECRPDRPEHCGQPCTFHYGLRIWHCAVCRTERFVG